MHGFRSTSDHHHHQSGSSDTTTTLDEDASKLSFGTEFENSTCLLNAEVFVLMQNHHQARSTLHQNAPSPVFEKTFSHVQTFSRYKNKEMIREVRGAFAASNSDESSNPKTLHEFEMAQLANLSPETCEEAKILIPSISSKISDDALQKILDDIQNARKFQF